MTAPRPIDMAADEPQGLELFLLKLRYKEGSLRTVEGNNPFLLDDPATAWVIYTGHADVFAVPVREGSAGARRHLFRAGVGTALFGLDAASENGLLLSGTPGTRLLRLDLARLRELAAELEDAPIITGLIDQWIAGLSAALARTVPPQAATLLDPEQEIALADGEVGLPRKGVLWVAHRAGGSRYLGRAALPLPGPDDPPAGVPLTRATWLQAAGPATLHAATTTAWLEQDPAWAGLAAFHRLALRTLAANREQDAAAEQARLHQQAEAQQAAMTGALTQIAALLEPAAAEVVSPVGEAGDPLLRACRVVGAAQGITIRPPPSPSGTPRPNHAAPDAVQRIADASSVRTRRVTLQGAWWRHDSGPLLAFTAEGRPVALLPAAGRRYTLVDPAARTRQALTPALAATLAPTAYLFYRPFPPQALTGWDLLRFGLRDCGPDLRLVVALGLLIGLLGMLTPVATGLIFDTLVPGAERALLWQVGGMLLAVAGATALFQVARSVALLRIEGRMGAVVQAAVWDRLLGLPVPFFRDYTAGDLGTRAMGINTIRQTLSGTVLTTILSGLFSLLNLGLLFYYDASLAWIAAGLVLLAMGVTTAIGYLQLRYQRQLVEVQGQLAGLVLPIINGIAKFRVAGAEGRAFALWAARFARQRTLAYQAGTVANTLAVFGAVYPILAALVLFLAVAAGARPAFTTGAFLAFSAAFAVLLFAGLRLSGAFLALLSIVPIYERARPILHTLPEADPAQADPGPLAGGVEVSHVSFRYGATGPPVLHDVSLRIAPGEFVALVGPSGSGKSTLLRLLLGFETPESGVITYDGQDLARLDRRAVRRQVGVVLQSGRLLSGDIFQNIVGGLPLSLDDAWEAARLAGLDAEIRQLPMGMHTLVSEGGSTLSGGQRQRLLIARAVVKRPRLVFFDEATSALDNRTQAIITQSLADLQATRIVIAHRLSTIVHADRIVVLDAGRIVQVGTYQELIDQPGLFTDLAKRQTV